MINILMNQKRGLNRFSKLPDDGDPWAPNNLLTLEQKKNTSWTPVNIYCIVLHKRIYKEIYTVLFIQPFGSSLNLFTRDPIVFLLRFILHHI